MNSGSGSTDRQTRYEDLKRQVQARLSQELGESPRTQSTEYHQFKAASVPRHHSWYEKAAAYSGKILPVGAGKKEERIKEQLETAHLDITPGQVMSLAYTVPLLVFFACIVFTVLIPFALTTEPSLWFIVFSLIVPIMVYVPLANAPKFLAQTWKQRASSQMVLATFYMVTFMRHTPNLELALEFASSHIGPPLSLDLKKVLWDVETQRYQTVKESLDHYLAFWREDAREFIEAINLIQSSLYETSNDRRLNSLDKSLEVMLDETYEKMLHYAQNLKSPMTMLHMLGIVLPILGLVILPLAVSFMNLHWTVILSLYNVLLPAGVFYLGKRILSTRPTGYGQADLNLMDMPGGRRGLSPAMQAGLVAGILFFVGISPLILHLVAPGFDIAFDSNGVYNLLGYTDDGIGPFGIGAGLLSLCVTLSAGIGLGLFYKRRVKSLIAIRERSRRLEQEFASSLFQLGNRIGDGIPAEIAFGKVATTMEGTVGGQFFGLVANNITRLGMGVDEAIFDPKHGALVQYPSNLIESSMKVLVESSRKGPEEASRALISMSAYIKEMHRVDERLKDLLSDVLSSMKSQVNFLMPTISGIVIGITSMITAVLGAIQDRAAEFEDAGIASQLPDLFGLGIPTFYFQIVVGLYVVQVTWILAYLINGVENGVDDISDSWIKGKSLIVSSSMYCGIAFVIILLFNIIAGQIMQVT